MHEIKTKLEATSKHAQVVMSWFLVCSLSFLDDWSLSKFQHCWGNKCGIYVRISSNETNLSFCINFRSHHLQVHIYIAQSSSRDLIRNPPMLHSIYQFAQCLKMLQYEETLLWSIYKVLSTCNRSCTPASVIIYIYKVLTTIMFPLKHSKVSTGVPTPSTQVTT